MFYPKPQKIDLNQTFGIPGPLTVTLRGGMPDLPELAELAGITGPAENGSVVVTVIEDNTKKTCYIEQTQTLTTEKYILNIEDTGGGAAVQLTAAGKRGVLYGLCTVAQMVAQNRFIAGETVDYPLFDTRGYIEGFYGKPWTWDQRCDILKLMARNKMNTVYYAPKDDVYHRERWRDLYPQDETASLARMIDLSQKAQMDFYYCIAPGLSVKYSDESEFEALMGKTMQLYSLGIRCFGLLLDDIPEQLKFAEDRERYGETVNAHTDLCCRYYRALKALDSANRLTVCPLQYFGRGNEYFISKFGQGLPADVSIFWTGRDVCSRELTVPEAFTFISATRHKPLYWDNYPVNDGDMFNRMHLGPIIGRDAELYRYSDGLIANCMEYAECSKIPLITIADYLWNCVDYHADESYANAIAAVVGQENAPAFECFADHLRTSWLLDSNSPKLHKLFAEAEAYFEAGDLAAALESVSVYVAKMNECNELLQSKSLPIFVELERWANKYAVFCDIINSVVEMVTSYDDEARDHVFDLIRQYNADPTVLTTFHLADLVESLMNTQL